MSHTAAWDKEFRQKAPAVTEAEVGASSSKEGGCFGCGWLGGLWGACLLERGRCTLQLYLEH